MAPTGDPGTDPTARMNTSGGDKPAAGPGVAGPHEPIWDLPERGSRGPKPRHDRAAIAAVAVQIADGGGTDALTMRRVARALGIATMSLYTYVPTRDHLEQLVIDHLAGEFVYPAVPASGRRAAVADLARQGRDIARSHPWIAGLMQRPSPLGPNRLRYLDYFLGLLSDSELDTGAKMEILALIGGFATMYGAMQGMLGNDRANGATSPDEAAAAQMRTFARAAASGQYPNLAAALAVAGPARSEDDIFESCITHLIDVAALGS
jgi:AcrR family transcriptional regulator